MATSSFETQFEVRDRKALMKLHRAERHAKKYTPTQDIDKTIEEGVAILKQSLSRSK